MKAKILVAIATIFQVCINKENAKCTHLLKLTFQFHGRL